MATSHLSLIIPVYNRPNEVEELLDSLTRQSETNFEVVIVEDGSKETCQHVVEAFKDKLDVSYSYILMAVRAMPVTTGRSRAKAIT